MSKNSSSRRQEVKIKLSIAGKGTPQKDFTCPKCGCTGGVKTMKRWGHGDLCIRNPENFRGKTKL